MRRYLLLTGLLLISPGIALAKDKSNSIEDAIRDEIREEVGLDDKQTGPGRPDDPGAHGRENAAEKQRQNPGKGSKGDEDWEDRLRDEFDDDDHKDKDKDKDKDKKKKDKGGKNKIRVT